MKELRELLDELEASAGERCALATLVRVQGSSYRRPGARMLVSSDGRRVGSLSAGCIEDEVAAHAQEVLQSGETKLIVFDTRRRFGCNGAIEIFIERVSEGDLESLRQHLDARRSCTLETKFEGTASALGTRIIDSPGEASDGVFVQTVEPILRLLIIGDGPDTEALRTQALLLGWECKRMESIATWQQTIDNRTAAVIATHNYGRDCAALRHLLPLGLRYVGVIGPRRRRDELLVDVLDTGVWIKSDLFAPAGLHLGAEAAEEIALSIVAEIQSVFTSASGVRLRDRKAPIHGEVSSTAQRVEACAASAR